MKHFRYQYSHFQLLQSHFVVSSITESLNYYNPSECGCGSGIMKEELNYSGNSSINKRGHTNLFNYTLSKPMRFAKNNHKNKKTQKIFLTLT